MYFQNTVSWFPERKLLTTKPKCLWFITTNGCTYCYIVCRM